MCKYLRVLPLVLQVLRAVCLYAGDACDEADGKGSCTPLSECPSAMSMIKAAGQPMPLHVRKKLQKLNCGFNRNEPMVCCDDNTYNPPIWTGQIHGLGPILPPDNGGRPLNNGRPPTNGDRRPPNTDDLNNSIDQNTPRTTVNDRGAPRPVISHPKLSLLEHDKCGSIENDRIWGGNRTRLLEMPWMVLLTYDSGRQGQKLSCGGTLINKWYVLTAAHCVAFLGNSLRLDGVIIGEYDIREDPDCETLDGVTYCAPNKQNVSIASTIAHKGYTPQTLVDDIALIRLAEPADFTKDNLKPMCLPIYPELQVENLETKNGVVAGWGVTEEGLQSPVLLSVELPILTRPECQEKYRGSPQIAKSQLCAGGIRNKDSCGGDSGGPLLFPGSFGSHGLKYIQRGIVSYGPKRCGIGGLPGVYTNVAYYMDWILDNMHE